MSDFRWDIGQARFSTYDADGFLGIQYDAEGEQNARVGEYEAHHFLGFMSRPLDPGAVDGDGTPDPTQTGLVLYAMEAGRGHIWPLEDPRVMAGLPSLQPGESMQYGCAGQFIRCHADGSITLMTTDAGGATTGNAVFLRVRPDELRFHAPWGKLILDATGFHVVTQSGARFDLSTIGGLPAPLSSVGSFANLSAGVVKVNGQAVFLGPSGGLADNAAQSTPLLVYLASMASAIQALAAAVGGFTGAGTFPALPAVVGALAGLSTPPPIQSSTAVA